MIMSAFMLHMRDELNAWMLHRADAVMDRIYGQRKRAIYSRLPNTVVEIGPGTGANLRYYAPNTRLIAIEPNRAMHPRLRSQAKRYNIHLQIKTMQGEQIDLPDASVSAVVGTLVLCSVQDPQQVIAEVRRILKPGGRYIFLEHVAAVSGTPLRGFQEKLLGIWRRLFDGCHLNRATNTLIGTAGFADVDMDCFILRWRVLPIAPHIFGVAVN